MIVSIYAYVAFLLLNDTHFSAHFHHNYLVNCWNWCTVGRWAGQLSIIHRAAASCPCFSPIKNQPPSTARVPLFILHPTPHKSLIQIFKPSSRRCPFVTKFFLNLFKLRGRGPATLREATTPGWSYSWTCQVGIPWQRLRSSLPETPRISQLFPINVMSIRLMCMCQHVLPEFPSE